MRPLLNFWLAFWLCGTGVATAWAQTAFPTTTKYDRANDLTTVQVELHNGDDVLGRLYLQINAAYRGKELNETTRLWFSLSQDQRNVARKAPPLLQSVTALALRTEADALALPVTNYRKNYYEMIRILSEAASVELDALNLKKLRAAQRLHGQWGHVEFTLNEKALATLKDFIVRHLPGATSGEQGNDHR